MKIKIAGTDSEVMGCYGIMSQLRPGIKEEDFLRIVKEQGKGGYKLAFIEGEGRVVSVAGFRVVQTLAWGKFIYVDDLVTDEKERSKGCGGKLIDYLLDHAKETGCKGFHLDSAVHRFLAHRFYFRKGLVISCYHFEKEL